MKSRKIFSQLGLCLAVLAVSLFAFTTQAFAKPIKIRLSGGYHEIANFVSGVAALPRIVTLHDINITPEGGEDSYDRLSLEVTAKTYRYLDVEAE